MSFRRKRKATSAETDVAAAELVTAARHNRLQIGGHPKKHNAFFFFFSYRVNAAKTKLPRRKTLKSTASDVNGKGRLQSCTLSSAVGSQPSRLRCIEVFNFLRHPER